MQRYRSGGAKYRRSQPTQTEEQEERTDSEVRGTQQDARQRGDKRPCGERQENESRQRSH